MTDTPETDKLKEEAKGYVKAKWYEFKRLFFSMLVVGLCAIFIIPPADRLVILYKAAVVTFAWSVWHILRSQGFPYLDYKTELQSGDPGRAIGASVLLGLTAIAVILGIANAF